MFMGNLSLGMKKAGYRRAAPVITHCLSLIAMSTTRPVATCGWYNWRNVDRGRLSW